MFTPAAKRRRIEAASTTLSKPFRSPFKTPVKVAVQGEPHSVAPHTLRDNSSATVVDVAALSKTLNCASPISLTARSLKGVERSLPSKVMNTARNADPVIAALVKSQRELEKQLRDLREELDIAKQAGKIELDSEKDEANGEVDGELRALIRKWKYVSREAVEELFTGVRERVNRVGGPKAWKEAQHRQHEFLAQFNEEPPPPEPGSDEEGDNHGEEEDLYAKYDMEPETETANEKEARGGNDVVDEDPEDVMYTEIGETTN